MLQLRITIFAFIIILILSPLAEVNVNAAEQGNSVKDCFENPDNCNDSFVSPDSGTGNETLTASSQFSGWEFFKMILATIFVVVLIYLLLKFVNKRSRLFNQYRYIENIGGTSLGTNRSIQLVKIGDRILVVGVGDSIQLLKEIDNEDEIKTILEEHNLRIDQLIHPNTIVNKVKSAFTKQNQLQNKESEQFETILKTQLQQLTKGRKEMLTELEKKGTTKK